MAYISKGIPLNLLATNVPADSTQTWDISTKYSYEEEVQHNDSVYVSAIEGIETNEGNTPGVSPTAWTFKSPVNAQKFMDESLETQTENNEEIIMTFAFHKQTMIAALNMYAHEVLLEVKNSDGDTVATKIMNMNTGGVSELSDLLEICGLNIDAQEYSFEVFNAQGSSVFQRTETLISRDVTGWSDWLLKPWYFKKDFFVNLPYVLDGTVTLTIKNEGGVAKIGKVHIGRMQYLAATYSDVKAGAVDKSRYEEDEFGFTKITNRGAVKLLDFKGALDSDLFDIVNQSIRENLGEEILLIADNRENGKDSFIVYGFVKNYSITHGADTSELSMSFQGKK